MKRARNVLNFTAAVTLMAALFTATAACGGHPSHPDHLRTGCEPYVFADDRSALAYFEGDWLIVRTAQQTRRVKRPRCLLEMVQQLAVSPGGATVASYAISPTGPKLTCLFDVASGRVSQPAGEGLLSWVGSQPVVIPQTKLPLPAAQCRAFATKDGPVAACTDEHDTKVRRFRGPELTTWGTDLSLPGGADEHEARERMLIGWQGRMLRWSNDRVRSIDLTDHEAHVRELGSAFDLLSGTDVDSLRSVEFEPGGPRLMLVAWEHDDRKPQPWGRIRLIADDGTPLQTGEIFGYARHGFWTEPTAFWLIDECSADRMPLPTLAN